MIMKTKPVNKTGQMVRRGLIGKLPGGKRGKLPGRGKGGKKMAQGGVTR